MPAILDINTPQVNPGGAPGNDYLRIQARPGAFGALTAQATEKIGSAGEKVGEDIAQIAQFRGRINVDDQVNQWITRRDSLMRGDPNKTITGPDGKPQPDRGYMGLEGRAASDNHADTLRALEQARLEGRNNLRSPAEQLAYDEQTRRMYSVAANDISQHADNQWKNWASGVNAAGAQHEINDFVNNLGDPQKMEGAAHNYIAFKVQQAQLKFGDDPDIKAETIANAKRDLLKAHTDAVAVKDPRRAIEILDSNKQTAGVLYDDMYAKLRARAAAQTGSEIASSAIARSRGGTFAAPVNDAIGTAASRYGIDPATLRRAAQIESGGNPNAVTGSYKGLFQLSTPEFRKYGPPGGNIWNPVDNAEAAAAKMKAEGDQFAKNFGRQPTGFDSYMIHQQGLAGYETHLANPNAPAWQNMAATGEGRQKGDKWAKQAIWGNIPDQYKATFGSVDNVTSRDFIAMWAAKFGSQAPSFSANAPAGSPGVVSAARPMLTGGPPSPASWQFPPEETMFGGQGRGAYEQAAFPMPAMASAIKPNVIQQVLDDPAAKADPEVMAHALRDANQLLNAQEIAENQTSKLKKEASDAAAGSYVTLLADMMHSQNPDYVALTGKIAHDPNLTWETKEKLMDRVRRMSGEEQALAFGPGYLTAREALFSSPDAPGHINDFTSLVHDPDITTAGLKDLQERMTLIKRSVDHQATERRVNSFLAGAKKDLSFEEDNGFIKLRDPKGEQIYNYQFVPDFVKRASELSEAAQKSGDHSKLDKFLSVENVKAMVRQYRNPDEMRADRMVAEGKAAGAPEAPDAPLPPPPEGVEAAKWRPVVSAAPISAETGKPVTHAQWGKVLGMLYADPSPKMMAVFDESYGHAGIRAEDVLRKLGVTPKTSNVPSPESLLRIKPATPSEPAAPQKRESPEETRKRLMDEANAIHGPTSHSANRLPSAL